MQVDLNLLYLAFWVILTSREADRCEPSHVTTVLCCNVCELLKELHSFGGTTDNCRHGIPIVPR